ncbi:MAG: signal peptide peptidase SppA [Ignavibacteriae bacterium]|nr:signal peptide peptidase SppA [Ignavibacteriota bacterium]
MNGQQKSNSGRWFWGIFISLIVIALIFTGIAFLVLAGTIMQSTDKSYDYEVSGSGKYKIAVVDLDFTILSSDAIVRQFKKYREDKSIKAIVLRINSPGGGVAASQEMYEEVRKTRDSGKPVIVSFASVAASGGYMVACGGTYIVSNPGSITGSIGVIMSFMTVKDLAEKLGIKETVVKSGKLKDSGNPFRDPNEDDLEYFQEIINDSYEQFLDVVSKERKIDREELKLIANGRVFTGRQALGLNLVDTLGTYEDALKIAARYGGIEGEPSIIREKESKRWINLIMENTSGSQLKEIKKEVFEEFVEKPVLQYKFEK